MEGVTEAMKIVCEELKKDPSYYYSWQANIAMAFKDEWSNEKFQQSDQNENDIHELANTAAQNFLNLLIK